MSIFDEVDTLCIRDNNYCKRKKQCLRYMVHHDGKWEANYWKEFNHFCKHQVPMPKKKEAEIVKASTKANDDQGS